MKSYKEIISESLNQPYKYKWANFDKYFAVGEFKTDANQNISFRIERGSEPNYYSTDFGKLLDRGRMTYSLTGSKDGFKVMATVLAMIREFIDNFGNNIYELSFEAEKTEMKPVRTDLGRSYNKKVETGRVSLYRRLIKKYIPNGWSLEEDEGPHGVEFMLTNNNFKRPVE